MRRSRAAACLVLAGALLHGPGLAAAGSTSSESADAPAEANIAPSAATSSVERWRLSAAAVGIDGPRQVVEVLADADGVIAFRAGARREGATERVAWEHPAGDAVALDGSWWTLVRPVQPVASREPEPGRLESLGVEVVDATMGDLDGDGTDEIVVVFQRAFRETVVSGLLPDVAGTDAAGRSLHLGLYDADLAQEWVAGTVFRPISAVVVCDGALALGFASSVAATDRVAAGASFWGGFGFTNLPGLPDLPGPGDPACADVDGDGRTEPMIINRNGRTSP